MATVTYLGTAHDTEVIPGVLAVGDRDGKTLKRVWVKQAGLRKIPLAERKVWGVTFPKDTPVEVNDGDLLRKCIGLGCFDVVGDIPAPAPSRARQRRRAREAELVASIATGFKQAISEVAAKAPVAPLPAEEPAAEQPKRRWSRKPKADATE